MRGSVLEVYGGLGISSNIKHFKSKKEEIDLLNGKGMKISAFGNLNFFFSFVDVKLMGFVY